MCFNEKLELANGTLAKNDAATPASSGTVNNGLALRHFVAAHTIAERSQKRRVHMLIACRVCGGCGWLRCQVSPKGGLLQHCAYCEPLVNPNYSEAKHRSLGDFTCKMLPYRTWTLF